MKVLVTGVNGQLGYDVILRLQSQNIECHGVGRNDFDVTNEVEVINYIKSYKPDVVVHCAAYTAVDKAEDEKDLCFQVNVLGTGYIARSCRDIGAKMVYISSDYVFNGMGNEPFDISHTPNPINYYGKTKYEGELQVQNNLDKYFVIRISWVFGINGSNFIKTMLRLGREKDQVNVVSDQIGSPTSTYDLAVLICDMIKTDKYGIYHATNEGFCSWYEFSKEIFKLANIEIEVNSVTTEEYPTRAVRPKNSRLSKKSLEIAGFHKLPLWHDALKRYLKTIK